MNSSRSLLSHLENAWPIAQWQNDSIVIAVSGGADSTALLDAIAQLRSGVSATTDTSNCQPLTIVAHYNHQLRGDDSNADETFVRTIASNRNLPVCIGRADESRDSFGPTDMLLPTWGHQAPRIDRRTSEPASRSSSSPSPTNEAALRRSRYAFLKSVAHEFNAAWIVTAHHANDTIETFLHNLLRGSGPRGLRGIPLVRRLDERTTLVRPFRNATRAIIDAYISQRGLAFRTDHTNAESTYTRNRIRNQLLPMLREFANSDHIDQRILDAISLIDEQHRVVEQLAAQWLESSKVIHNDRGFQLPKSVFENTEWVVCQQALTVLWHRNNWPLREMNIRHWKNLQKLIERGTRTTHPQRLQLPGHIQVTMRRNNLAFHRG